MTCCSAQAFLPSGCSSCPGASMTPSSLMNSDAMSRLIEDLLGWVSTHVTARLCPVGALRWAAPKRAADQAKHSPGIQLPTLLTLCLHGSVRVAPTVPSTRRRVAGRDRVEVATGKEPVAPDLGTQDGKSASQEGRESRTGPWHETDKIAPASAETSS
jgi:hypothetical protein